MAAGSVWRCRRSSAPNRDGAHTLTSCLLLACISAAAATKRVAAECVCRCPTEAYPLVTTQSTRLRRNTVLYEEAYSSGMGIDDTVEDDIEFHEEPSTTMSSTAPNECILTVAAGQTGAKGEPGLPGKQGLLGLTGMQGQLGPPGERGATGLRGQTGEQGTTGEDGLPGPPGRRGADGPPGTPGVRGPQGEQGQKGQRGETGSRAPRIAFQSRLRDHLGPSERADRVVLDNVEANEGGSFDGGSGVFVCRYSGTYIFHLNVMVHDEHVAWLALRHNGKPKAYAWANGRGTAGSGLGDVMGTAMAVLWLRAGDVVDVTLVPSADPPNYLYAHYTTLAGYLLFDN